MSIMSFNNEVACLAPEKVESVGTVSGGLKLNQDRTGLVPLRVRYAAKDLPEGAKVYVPSAVLRNNTSLAPVEFDGEQLIFVPLNLIKLVSK